MAYKLAKSQKGFTLVELAIVLVIIGLIVSGVLVGQVLIKAAELRATTRQLQSFQVAVNAFIGKYAGIPGDVDGNRYGLDGGCDSAADGDGDGDGLLEDSGGAGTPGLHDGEVSCFWANLTTSGQELIPGVYDGYDGGAAGAGVHDVVSTNMPKMKFGSRGWGVFNDGSNNYFLTGVIGGQGNDFYNTSEPFVPVDAFNIDSKIDDGVPTSGDVVAVNGQTVQNPDLQTGVDFTNVGVLATACQNTATGPDEYQFTATASLCNMMFRMHTF